MIVMLSVSNSSPKPHTLLLLGLLISPPSLLTSSLSATFQLQFTNGTSLICPITLRSGSRGILVEFRMTSGTCGVFERICYVLLLQRDDLSGMQLSGNKVRKLEFLMADAVAQGADCIITIGGIQSNHCRAAAVAAKYLNLDCYLILRTSKVLVDQDPGLTGNLLVERLVGAHIELISKEEYSKIGSVTLTNILKEKLLKEGRRPYVIPVGGSNSIGTWGYIEAIKEIEQQLQTGTGGVKFDDIVVACGSGGTIAGLSLGSWLGTLKAKVHAFSVCDDPDYFYDYTQGLLDGLNAGVDSHDIVNIQNSKGLGYAINTSEELNFVKDIAAATGVVLDPVYSGKAAYGMLNDMAQNPKKWEGRKVLFVHTGGLLGLFDKVDQMAPRVKNWSRMDVHESVPRKDGTGKMF
ncbi:putative D-cysteine desulfhydrase 1, mitochondrial isoform X1 [Citrus sinensis]|uniref:putative D-cysteine desulfhydrase 1, mitochondrial isoform X1 n=1 Tax=Citrus sinensis TaxID=2711 RepID=UPI0022783231|nr:putative D-cysteine desulfhydrase 1, mitochondrial isoform X1 [Citrus sinensis]